MRRRRRGRRGGGRGGPARCGAPGGSVAADGDGEVVLLVARCGIKPAPDWIGGRGRVGARVGAKWERVGMGVRVSGG